MSGNGWRDRVVSRIRPVAPPPASAPAPVSAPAPASRPWRSLTGPGPMLVLLDDRAGADQITLPGWGPRDVVIHLGSHDGSTVGRAQRSVLLVTRDRDTLRTLAPGLPRLAPAASVSCFLYATREPLVVRPRPEWPTLRSAQARLAFGGTLSTLRFTEPVRPRSVIKQMARQALPTGRDLPSGGLFVGTRADGSGALMAGVHRVVAPEHPQDGDAVPLDALIVDAHTPLEALPVSPITGRAPVMVAAPQLEPYDERLVNPVGWRAEWTREVCDVDTLGLGERLHPGTIAGLRDLQGVRVELGRTSSALVAGLAMAGVPLLAEGTDPVLAPALGAALDAAPDLEDPLAREEHSLTVRRAALEAHTTHAHAAAVASRVGVGFPDHPSVSVLMATKRPELLDFALSQVARQDVPVELVLATHGFTVDPATVRAALGGAPCQVVAFDRDTVFGEVLRGAAEVASGHLMLKMDDDDWYSPRFVRDLLLARRYADAQVVGVAAEFVHLAERDRTVRRRYTSERYARFVAGGTIMLDRVLLTELGGFRPTTRFVDAQLLRAARDADVRVYRSHGLGYLLRRAPVGHTWDREAEEFERPGTISAKWPGLRGSTELELAPQEVR